MFARPPATFLTRPLSAQPHVKPHLVMRSARYKKIRRELAAKERAEVNKRKAEQLRQKREESEVLEATGRRDAPVCAWLATHGLEQYYSRIRKFGAVRPEELLAKLPTVHRLDKSIGGVLLVACSSAASGGRLDLSLWESLRHPKALW